MFGGVAHVVPDLSRLTNVDCAVFVGVGVGVGLRLVCGGGGSGSWWLRCKTQEVHGVILCC